MKSVLWLILLVAGIGCAIGITALGIHHPRAYSRAPIDTETPLSDFFNLGAIHIDCDPNGISLFPVSLFWENGVPFVVGYHGTWRTAYPLDPRVSRETAVGSVYDYHPLNFDPATTINLPGIRPHELKYDQYSPL